LWWVFAALVSVMIWLVGAASPAGAQDIGGHGRVDEHEKRENEYRVTNLVSDQPNVAVVQDPNLVNAWGLAAGPNTPLWVSDNGTDVTTLYSGAVGGSQVTVVPLVVSIPDGAPTGQVFNPTGGFQLTEPGGNHAALFLFASEHGTISGWNQQLMPLTSAQRVATSPGAVYKGLALANTGAGPMLYAADFHGNKIDVFDSQFMPVHRPGAFVDPRLPDGFAPFNVQEIDGKLYVTYAKQGPTGDDVAGPGNGFVDVFTPQGSLVRRLVSRGLLNSPWGVAIAPADFGRFGGALLVGNFGDGRIHAYDAHTGRFLGTLRDDHHQPITIDGLWGLRFGNGVAGSPTTLLFSAGPGDESHGLLGTLDAQR
jgi:uncharacterized protein (TIGR03118 family)